jgi:hypothetical protein
LGIHSFRSLVVIGCILWIAFVVEATQFIQYSRNVLFTNGQWVSSTSMQHVVFLYRKHDGNIGWKRGMCV